METDNRNQPAHDTDDASVFTLLELSDHVQEQMTHRSGVDDLLGDANAFIFLLESVDDDHELATIQGWEATRYGSAMLETSSGLSGLATLSGLMRLARAPELVARLSQRLSEQLHQQLRTMLLP